MNQLLTITRVKWNVSRLVERHNHVSSISDVNTKSYNIDIKINVNEYFRYLVIL